jgi:hypothetical protein
MKGSIAKSSIRNVTLWSCVQTFAHFHKPILRCDVASFLNCRKHKKFNKYFLNFFYQCLLITEEKLQWKMRKFFFTFLIRYVKEIYRRMCTILLVKVVYGYHAGQRTCIPMVNNRRLRATVKIPEKMVRMDTLFPGIQTLGGQIRNFC